MRLRRSHLSVAEIVKIHTLKRAGVGATEIAKRMELKSRTSVYKALALKLEDLV